MTVNWIAKRKRRHSNKVDRFDTRLSLLVHVLGERQQFTRTRERAALALSSNPETRCKGEEFANIGEEEHKVERQSYAEKKNEREREKTNTNRSSGAHRPFHD